MQHPLIFSVLIACLLLAVPIKSQDEYGQYHYSFDNDTVTASCTKPKPLIFELMFDFLTMIKAESGRPTQQCVLNNEGPGFISPPTIARHIFTAMTIAYNTFARYSQYANATLMYEGWSRMPHAQTQEQVPNCVYIYGFYHISNFLMPERVANYSFKENYERKYECDLTEISATTSSNLGLVQRDVDQLKAYLRTDGFNQEGCYADTSNYKPANPPCLLDNKTTIEICRNFSHTYNTVWSYGEIWKTGYINKPRRTSVPHTHLCKPFSLGKLQEYIATPYFDAPSFENGTMMSLPDQFLEVVNIQEGLGVDHDKPKLITEYWASGPNTAGTPGHWQSITLNIIRRLCYDNSDAIKLLFGVSAATYDASIAAWQSKRLYSTVRPVVYIPTEHMYATFKNQFVGMYCNFMDIEGWQWTPYLEETVITPDFQEYISGHSTFSRAAAVVLEALTGSPIIPGNLSVTIKAGQSLYQPRCNQSNATCYKKCRVNDSLDSENNYIPKVDVTLGPWKTYREIADEASISRKYGGIHIASGDIQGRIIGQKVGDMVSAKLLVLFNEDPRKPTSDSMRLQFHVVFYLIALIYYYDENNM
ncbi:unnamed protein product [Rotaria magnacalcarata]|uniref:Uncharacterized protein n=1 Tax=Rotaria magnacalcarata TaxID=392030 RepID=A0A816BS31_9BILA|nr:unnamed protein product [Rotaria magnacalcarata]CAF1614115.1 unnamed protein product [Rotaria magnacalcarata]CAF2081787.1 unnamed protein product [Rotaria magnacalcarata]CAF2138915.1 unnamed protein product [Rotaria magnacalcarata]CAF3799646.1 unnamed protein product [Rotaria magnacalcarata]